jgi:hypothetical protein
MEANVTFYKRANPITVINPVLLAYWDETPIDTTIHNPLPPIDDRMPFRESWERLRAEWDDPAAEEQSEEHDDRGGDPEPVQR